MLLLIACPDSDEGGNDVFSSTAPTTTVTASSTDASTSDATTSSSDTSSSGEAESSSTAVADESSSSSSAGEMPVCGNGMVELGEQCDDMNDSDLDECTVACTVPRCDDGMIDGLETDVDCGGVCQGCDLCLACLGDDDCGQNLVCGDEGQCIISEVMSVHWNANCGGVAQGATIEGLPLGMYRATALSSAGTLWLPPFNPPMTGYFYEILCGGGVQLGQIRTPPTVRYASVAAAFAALQATEQEFDFLGGDLTCYRTDDTCNDNSGSVDFQIDYICGSN